MKTVAKPAIAASKAVQQSQNREIPLTLSPATLEARRAELAKRIRASSAVNALESFCAVIACGFAEPPHYDGEPGEIACSEQAVQQFLVDRAALIKRLKSNGAGWFGSAQETLAEDLLSPLWLGGESGARWKKLLDSLGLTMQDLIREAIVAELVALKVAPTMHPVRAGGVA